MTDKVPPIEDDVAHHAAMEEINRLWGAVPGRGDVHRLADLVQAVDAYERARWPADYILTTVTDERGLISIEDVARALELEIDDVARLLRISPSVLREDQTSRDVQRVLRTIVDILTKASAVFLGGPHGAIDWFKSRRLDRLGDKTPAALCEAGHSEAVVHYLDLLENGIFD